MKKYFMVVFTLFLIGNMFAVSEAATKDGFEIGTEVYYFNYKEPDFMEDKGAFFGVNASYTKHFKDIGLFGGTDSGIESIDGRSVIRLDGRFAYGQVDYSSPVSGNIDGIDDYVFETRLTGGYDFNIEEKSYITPYLGLGYRYLIDDTSEKATTTGAFGYKRTSRYLYMPLGVDIHGPINDRWDANLNVEFDVLLSGKQKSHLGDAVAGLNTVSNDQNDGYGVRGSIRFTKENANNDLFIEPFVRYWHIGDSDVSAVTYNGVLFGYGLEPENKTIEVGAKIGLRF